MIDYIEGELSCMDQTLSFREQAKQVLNRVLKLGMLPPEREVIITTDVDPNGVRRLSFIDCTNTWEQE